MIDFQPQELKKVQKLKSKILTKRFIQENLQYMKEIEEINMVQE